MITERIRELLTELAKESKADDFHRRDEVFYGRIDKAYEAILAEIRELVGEQENNIIFGEASYIDEAKSNYIAGRNSLRAEILRRLE